MIQWFLNAKKFIPDEYVKTIFDIDYNKLYESGKRLILTDLDNTLISYKETDPNEALYKWLEEMHKIGFEVIIVSNSRKNRVSYFANLMKVKHVKFATKPLTRGLRKAIKMASRKYSKDEIFEIGDQLMTDVYGSKRLGLYTIFVEAIDKKTEIWTTRFNRRLEKKVLKKVERKYPELYNERLKEYARGIK